MKNKKVLFVISCVVLLIVLDRCTKVKISSASIFEKEEFKTYPFLSNGVTSDSYEIKQIVKEEEDSYLDITYDTINNYFIISTREKWQKISAKGKVLNTIKSTYPISDKDKDNYLYPFPDYLWNPNKSYFIMGNTRDSLVYDLSKNKIEEKLTEIISTSQLKIKTEEEWLVFYTPYYNMADVVIYRRKFENSEDVQPIYLRIDNKWILILFSGDCNLTLPEKYPKELIYLKDYNREVYSELHFEQTPWESTDTPEKGIEKVFFRKDHIYSRLHLYYYEVFPHTFKGLGFYNLKKGEEVLKFKNWMLQSFYFKERTNLYYYTLPERFRNKSEVTFIVYSTRVVNDPNQGLYIVKRKSNF